MNKLFRAIALAIGETLLQEGAQIVIGLASGMSRKLLATPNPKEVGIHTTAIARALTRKTIDGALLSGPRGKEWAKFTLKKGLPVEGGRPRMAVENEPHSVDDFDGEIKEGYGKGTKTLTYAGQTIVKLGAGSRVGRANVHLHRAERAGEHTDFVVEGVDPHTNAFEVNIPNGPNIGRYAFRKTFEENEYLVVRMKDRSVLVAKPDIHLKPKEFLSSLTAPVIVEHKLDGSLGNAAITDNRAVFRSHRIEGSPYYDKLPALENIGNRSSVALARWLFPGPKQDGTVLRGELLHPDGAARVGGILNALPANARNIQDQRGPVSFIVWDITKLRGKDVSSCPYDVRRRMYEAAVKDIRCFNNSWHVAKQMPEGEDPLRFYESIINDPRGLPYSEGVVVKYKGSIDDWFKVKNRDTIDMPVVEFIPGTGKYAGSLGALLVEGPTGVQSEVGSLQITDAQRQWMWNNRDLLRGQIAEIKAMDITDSGAVRAGVFSRWHPSKSEYGLLMYAEGIAGSTNPEASRPVVYAVKSAAGWRGK